MSEEKKEVINITKETKDILEIFYQQKESEALEKFEPLLMKILKMVDILFAYKEIHEGFSLEEDKIKGALEEALNALEERDFILVADILQYDFIEYIENLADEME